MAGQSCGTHRRYTAGCPQCRRAEMHYDRRRRRAIANGTWQPQVPAANVRGHIDQLRAAGMSLIAIARAANVAPETVYPIAAGERRHIQGPTAAMILAVAATRTVPAGKTLAIGTSRRVRALVAAGYSLTDQGRRLGRAVQQMWELAHDRHQTVTDQSAAGVAAMYRELSLTSGPSVRARNDGKRRGWPPPSAWDDDIIDDPQAIPDLGNPDATLVDDVLVQRALAGNHEAVARLSQPERLEAVRRLVRRQLDAGAISRRLGVSGTTAKRLVAAAQDVAA